MYEVKQATVGVGVYFVTETVNGRETVAGSVWGYSTYDEAKFVADRLNDYAIAMHPDVIRQYGGNVHGTDRFGNTDIEFPSVKHAASWASDIEAHVTFRDPVTYLHGSVVLTVAPKG